MKKTNHLIPDDRFLDTIKNSFTIAEVLRKLGLSIYGSSYRFFRLRCKSLSADTSHFTGATHRRGKTNIPGNPKYSMDQILVQDSHSVFTGGFKRRLIRDGLIKEECAICGMGPVWQEFPLTLQIDHINGDCFDHRLENLRLLCPNCHTQTSTFGSKSANHPIKARSSFTIQRI
jgi:hypothetical protein